MSPQVAATTLKAASALVMASGAVMFLSVFTGLQPLLNLFVDLAHLPVDGGQSIESDAALLLTGICGGILVGWGLMAWMVTGHVYAHDPEIGGRILLRSILVWFVIDGTGSVLAGAWFNVVLNCSFLLAFLVPLILARPAPAAQAT